MKDSLTIVINKELLEKPIEEVLKIVKEVIEKYKEENKDE